MFTISENVNICDAEHGFSSVFFSGARVSALYEWRPEIEPEAITSPLWTGYQIQCEEIFFPSPSISPPRYPPSTIDDTVIICTSAHSGL